MGLPFIGLNQQFKTIITNEVNIVFHMASVIKFNLNIADAANFNTIGTQRLLDLCSNIKNLKVCLLIHMKEIHIFKNKFVYRVLYMLQQLIATFQEKQYTKKSIQQLL